MGDNKTDPQKFFDWLGGAKLDQPIAGAPLLNDSIVDGYADANTIQSNWEVNNLVAQVECEPLRTVIREYLDEKGLEYSTGGYVEHQVHTSNAQVQLQLTILNISKKMMAEVVGPALVEISRNEQVGIDLVMTEGDDKANTCVVVRFGK